MFQDARETFEGRIPINKKMKERAKMQTNVNNNHETHLQNASGSMSAEYFI